MPTSASVRPEAWSLMSSSAEKNAPPDSTRRPSRASRRKSLQAQSTSRIVSGELVGDGRRRVAAAVVDDDDLPPVGECRQRRERLVDERPQVGLLVVGRKEVRQPRDASRLGNGGHGGVAAAAARPLTIN